MRYNYLGRSGLKVSNFSLGTWISSYEPEKVDSYINIIKQAYSLGINFFDTAEGYGLGKSELVLGRAIKELNVPREKLVIATKIFWGQKQGSSEDLTNEIGLSRKHIHEAIKKSLQRLQLSYVDIVFCHRYDYDLELEEVCRSMHEIVKSGQTLYWGTSNWPAAYISAAIELCRAKGWHEPVAEQSQYNLLYREEMEKDYIPLFTRYGYGATVWSPLADGLLTGKYNNGKKDEGRLINPEKRNRRFGNQDPDKIFEALKNFESFAKNEGFSMAQMALAWTIANSNTSTCILGASSILQLEENLKSLELAQKWKREFEDELDKIFGTVPFLMESFKTFGKKVMNRKRTLRIDPEPSTI